MSYYLYLKKDIVKRKSVQKKSNASKLKKNAKTSYSFFSRYIIISGVVLLIALSGIQLYNLSQNTSVLGTNTYLADKADSSNVSGDSNTSSQEKPDKVEPIDTPEPTDIPEKKQAVEKVQQEINKQVENNSVTHFEIQPPNEGSNSGKVILQQSVGTTQEIQTPISNTTPITQISTQQAGTLSVHIGGANNITINNGPYRITTQYPVVINPADQSMAIKTPNGITVIKTFPSQVFQNLPTNNKLSSISSLNLTDQQGVPVYQADGIQVRKFLGIIPVNAPITEQINAQTGQVINTSLPWYYSIFGFAFQST